AGPSGPRSVARARSRATGRARSRGPGPRGALLRRSICALALAQAREVGADQVAFAARDEALVGGVEGGLLVALDDLGVRGQGHVWRRAQRRGVGLGLARQRGPRHVDPLGALCGRARSRARSAAALTARAARAARAAAAVAAAAVAVAVAIPIPIPVAVPIS